MKDVLKYVADICDMDPTNYCRSSTDPGVIIGEILNKALNTLYIAVGFAGVIAIIYGGYQMLTSAGNPSKVENGKKALIGGVIGVAIAMLAGTITMVVHNLASDSSNQSSGGGGGGGTPAST